MESVLVVLVVLEGLEEIVVLGKGLASSFGHVEGALLQLFTPKSGRFLSLVTHIRIDQLLQLLVARYLSSLLETQ